jgi:hypothetical protein
LGTSGGKFLGCFAPGPDENAIFAKTSNRNERGVGCGCHIVELSFRRQKFPKTTKIVFYPFQVVETLNKIVISAFEWHFVIIDRSISFWCVADNPVARFAYENLHNKVSQLFYSP